MKKVNTQGHPVKFFVYLEANKIFIDSDRQLYFNVPLFSYDTLYLVDEMVTDDIELVMIRLKGSQDHANVAEDIIWTKGNEVLD